MSRTIPFSQAKEASMETDSDQEINLEAVLNDIGQLKLTNIKNISSVEREVDYKVTDIRPIATKYGERIIVELGELGWKFLPARFTKSFLSNEKKVLISTKKQIETGVRIRLIGGKFNVVKFSIYKNNL